MDKNPLRHNLNPAFQPACKFYIGMPLVSSINFNVGNNCLSFEDVFQGKTINGEKQADPEYTFVDGDRLYGRYTLLRRGKKNYCLVCWK